MSTFEVDAKDRIPTGSLVVNTAGQVIVGDSAALWEPVALLQPPGNFDEHGELTVGVMETWTATNVTGHFVGRNESCFDFTADARTNGGVGLADKAVPVWVSAAVVPCSSTYRIYCFDDLNSNITVLLPNANLRMFATSTQVMGNSLGGIPGADLLCAARANEAGIDPLGTAWIAALSNSTLDLRDRIPSGYTVRSVDANGRAAAGAYVAADAADLFSPTNIIYPPGSKDEFGTTFKTYQKCLSGSTAAGVVGSKTCGDWTGDGQALSGSTFDTVKWLDAGTVMCSFNYSIYCFDNMEGVPPTLNPSRAPTQQPTSSPTAIPSLSPTQSPSRAPTKLPSTQPTISPTVTPASPTSAPTTNAPSANPSVSPTDSPTQLPSSVPSTQPSALPSLSPTRMPSNSPSMQPTQLPSSSPTVNPGAPTAVTPNPTVGLPSAMPSVTPTQIVSVSPSSSPTTSSPSSSPTVALVVISDPQVIQGDLVIAVTEVQSGGTLQVNGSVTLESTSQLTFSTAMPIVVSGNVVIDGELNLVFASTPPSGTVYEVFQAGSISGPGFQRINATFADQKSCEIVRITPNSVAGGTFSVTVSVTSRCGLSVGAVAAIVAGVILLVVAGVACPLGIRRFRRKKREKATLEGLAMEMAAS